MTDRRLVLLGCLLPMLASAGESLRAAVLPCAGKGGAAAARKVAQALQGDPSLEIVERGAVQRALAGQKLGAASDFAHLAKKLGLGAIVSCRTVRGPGGRAKLVLRDASGAVVERLRWSGSGAKLASRIAALSSEGEEVDADDGSSDEEVAEPAAKPAKRTHSAKHATKTVEVEEPEEAWVAPEYLTQTPRELEVSFGAGVQSRNFYYSEQLPAGSRTLRHSLPAVLALQANVDFFPFANVGLELGGQTLAGAGTRLADDTQHATSSYAFEGGIVGRYTLGFAEFRSRLTLGHHTLDAGITGHGEEALPRVAYSFVQPTIGVRLHLFSLVTAQAEAGYRFMLGAGELNSSVYLQKVSAGGLELSALVTVKLYLGFELQLRGSYRRYFFKALPTDTLIAGAAVDQYAQATLGLGYHFGF